MYFMILIHEFNVPVDELVHYGRPYFSSVQTIFMALGAIMFIISAPAGFLWVGRKSHTFEEERRLTGLRCTSALLIIMLLLIIPALFTWGIIQFSIFGLSSSGGWLIVAPVAALVIGIGVPYVTNWRMNVIENVLY
jgi:hypothetical protein